MTFEQFSGLVPGDRVEINGVYYTIRSIDEDQGLIDVYDDILMERGKWYRYEYVKYVNKFRTYNSDESFEHIKKFMNFFG